MTIDDEKVDNLLRALVPVQWVDPHSHRQARRTESTVVRYTGSPSTMNRDGVFVFRRTS